ncbi:MAG: hypothetical protein GF317_21350 [Candidatus Lokiarchaeota archaeon]|nr:hypothetical protein [Candidatus Lokiarchaeota archaeon]MBD3202003.1 hypothetical protein [Candidatus Lokiarchaeota archaeon]
MDCYNKIIKFYENENVDRNEIEVWKSKSYIKLMNKLSEKNKKLTQNAIVLILSLFENIPPDIYNNRGFGAEELSENQKNIIISKLKEEYI